MDVIDMTRGEQINKAIEEIFNNADIALEDRAKLKMWYSMGAKFADDNPKDEVNWQHFKDEGVDGFGFCVVFKCIHHCTGGGRCDAYQLENNSWTELTPDNVDDLYPVIDRVVVAYKLGEGLAGYSSLTELYKPLKDLALTGGYYFFVLPGLKIE